MTVRTEDELFGCGHPREPDNSWTALNGTGTRCKSCARVRQICRAVVRDQARINAGEIVGRPGHRNRYQYV